MKCPVAAKKENRAFCFGGVAVIICGG